MYNTGYSRGLNPEQYIDWSMKFKISVLVIISILLLGATILPYKGYLKLFNLSTEQVVKHFFYIRTYEGYARGKNFIDIIKQGKLIKDKKQRKEFIDLYGSDVWNKFFSINDFDDNEWRAIDGDSGRKGDWYFYLMQTTLENLADINLDNYRQNLLEENYKNFKTAVTVIRNIISEGLISSNSLQREEEIRLKMAVFGINKRGERLPIEFSMAALLQLRMDAAQHSLQQQNNGNLISDNQNKLIIQKLLIPVYVENFLFVRVFPAGAVNKKLLDGNKLYVKKEDVPESVINLALGIIKSNKSKNVSNSDMLELVANILVFGYQEGAKRWLRINNFTNTVIPTLRS